MQRSALDLLLFILYFIDIQRYLAKNDVNIYADDTVISVSDVNFEDVIETINKELIILEIG